MRVQGKSPETEAMGEGGRFKVMFEYLDFLHFGFRGI